MAAALFCVGNVSAQDNEFSDPFATPQKSASSASDRFLFNHLGAGVSIGLDGIGVELATPVTPYLGLRAGVSFFPKINVNVDDIDYTRNGNKGKGEAKAKLNKFDGKVLLDVYPFGNKLSMHVTGGLFIGGSNLITASFIEDANAPIGGGIAKMINGEQWNVRANNHAIDLRLRTNGVKPYIGIGFGQHIAKTHRVSLAVDAGLMFWGTPKFVLNNGTEIESSGKDSGITSVVSWLKAWPNLQIRVAYKIF